MKTYDIEQLRSLPIYDIADLPEDEFIVACWKESGIAVLEAIDNQHAQPMTKDDFLSHCTDYGSDLGRMLLSGINALYPEVYDAIPNNMGAFAWRCICGIIELLRIGGTAQNN